MDLSCLGLTPQAGFTRLAAPSHNFEGRLGHHLVCEKINASRVAARPSEAGDKSEPDRVFADAERSVMFAVVKNSTMAARIPPRI